MRVRVHHDIGDLANDCVAVARRVKPDMRGVVRDGIRAGNELAKGFAKQSAGKHGKHYYKAFRAEMTTSLFGAAGDISGEYGPVRGMRQGDMSFEWGSRNQRPHLDLNRSADIIGGSFAQEVSAKSREWFW